MTSPSTLAAILTGGASRRMHGRPKGLLPDASGEPLVRRTARLFASMAIPCLLIGHRTLYAPLGLPLLDDHRPGEGPLAALETALREASARGHAQVLLVACDMPYLTTALLARLHDAPVDAPAVAFSREGRLEPLCARYATALLDEVTARLDRGERALSPLLRAVATPLSLDADEAPLLDDWDTPEQMSAARRT